MTDTILILLAVMTLLLVSWAGVKLGEVISGRRCEDWTSEGRSAHRK